MPITKFSCAALLGVALVTGCANNPYFDARQRTAAGGELDQKEAAAQRDLEAERRRQAGMQVQRQGIDTEIARNSQRISALQGDLKKQDAQLAAALSARKITKAQHDQIKRQVDGLRADANSAELENQRAAVSKAPGNDAAKQAELAKLEERKRALEKTLSAMTAAR